MHCRPNRLPCWKARDKTMIRHNFEEELLQPFLACWTESIRHFHFWKQKNDVFLKAAAGSRGVLLWALTFISFMPHIPSIENNTILLEFQGAGIWCDQFTWIWCLPAIQCRMSLGCGTKTQLILGFLDVFLSAGFRREPAIQSIQCLEEEIESDRIWMIMNEHLF